MTKKKKFIRRKTKEELHVLYTKPFRDGHGWNEKRVKIYLELEKARTLTDIVNNSVEEFGLSNVGFMKRAREEGVVLPDKYRNGWIEDGEPPVSPEAEEEAIREFKLETEADPLEPIAEQAPKKQETIPEMKLPEVKPEPPVLKMPEAKIPVPPKQELNPKVVEQINEIKEPAETKPLLPDTKSWREKGAGEPVCPRCGKPIEEGANFCAGCGQKFGEEEKKDNKVYSPANLFTQSYKIDIKSGVLLWYHYCCARFGYTGNIAEWLNDCAEDCVKARGWTLAIIESPEVYAEIGRMIERGNHG
jgi:hypothetical protein